MILLALAANAAEIRGRVKDANTGEALAKAAVRVLPQGARGESANDGSFRLEIGEAGPITLLLTCSGYRPLKVTIEFAGSEVEATLVPDTLRRAERVDVTAGIFATESPASVGLAGNELRNLASVLADDPLRAVQGLPGVNANDDFRSQISLRGAGPERVGIYLDGILLHSPYHSLQGEAAGASLSIISADLLEHADLHSGPIPPQFYDRGAAAIDMGLREGDRKKIAARVAASASNVSGLLEGPLGRQGKGSWLVSARKSYLQYLISRTSDLPSLTFAFSDVQGRVSYDVAPGHTLTFSAVQGTSGLDRTGAESTVGINSYFFSDFTYTMLRAGSRYTKGSLILQQNAAWVRESYENQNKDRNPLLVDHYGEWIAQSDNTWQITESHSVLFGGMARRMRDDGRGERRLATPPYVQLLERSRGTGVRTGAYVMPMLTLFGGKVTLRGGGRADHHDVSGETALSPYASAALRITSVTSVHVGWGHSAQYPELNAFFSTFGRKGLALERSAHWEASLEQRLDERTRVRVEAYGRSDRNVLNRPLYDPRVLNGRFYGGNNTASYENSLNGTARGGQVFLQRRTANGITGWIAYSYSVAKSFDGVTNAHFPSDYDQRHTGSAYLSYRLRPTVNLSGRWVYGSGFPIPQFLIKAPVDYLLSPTRNSLRLPSHQRLDLRANKTFVKRGVHFTLYAELINVYNHDNIRYADIGGVDTRTGRARISLERMFPVLPSAGLAVEF